LGLGTHKSEKTLPSFLAGSRKIGSTKGTEKKGLSKNNFRILRQMGEGKFGNVFLVMEIFTGMIVAMKAIPKKKVLEENMLTQIIREMKIQTFLDHPNIIKNYGFFCDEEYFYTLMEVGCDGQLYDLMEGGSTLSEESTSFIIGNLLEAVENMHNRKILHRDIKPENIVLVHVKDC
jgi:aurora kinase, other